MKLLTAGLIDLLKRDSAVQALVADRVFEDELPRGYGLPALCVHTYGGVQEYDLRGRVGSSEKQLQVDAYVAGDGTETLIEAVKDALGDFVGTLTGGTVVQGCFYEREQTMPFYKNADVKGIVNRSLVGFRVVFTR